MEIKWKKVHPSAKQPTRKDGDACWDLYVVADSNFVDSPLLYKKIFWLDTNKSYTFDIGIQTEIPEHFCAIIFDRSGMGSKNIHRFAGVIDSSYRGNWKVHLFNFGESCLITEGNRIAQALIVPVFDFDWTEVNELEESNRGEKGFGSSGK